MSESRDYVTLGELADLNPESLGAKTPKDHTFKYIDLTSVSHGSIDMASLEQFRFVDAPSRARRVVRDGDVLFGTVRPRLRSHARVGGHGYVASTGFCVTRARPGVADSGFLGHFLLSDEATRQATRREVGSNYPAVTERDVATFRLPRIPLEEQRRIAQILDTIDETIQATERIIAKQKRVRAGLAADVLSGRSESAPSKNFRPNETPPPPASTSTSRGSGMSESRDYVTLGELADLNPESLGAKTPKDHTFKYIDLTSVSHGSIDMASLEQFRFVDAPSRARRVVRDGDVLFGTVRPRLRSHARVGGHGYVASTGFCVTRARLGVADSGFLGHFLLSDEATRQATRREVGSNYPAVTERDVATFRLPRIPLEEQRRIAQILDTIDETIQATEQQLGKLSELRSGLAADLLSGRVRTLAA